jgi:membrane protease subunit (stomatin/prohibitin family)
MMRDKDFGMVRVTAFGLYSIRAKDPAIIIRDLRRHRQPLHHRRDPGNLRGKVGSRIKEVMPELGIPVIEMEAKVIEMGTRLKEQAHARLRGLRPRAVVSAGAGHRAARGRSRRRSTSAGAIAAVGNLQAYTQYETASSIRDAANNPGGSRARVGLGAGVRWARR